MKVCHLTTVHNRNDTRIFLKECVSLKKAGYLVYLLVADGLGNDQQNGIQIVDVGNRSSNRISRFILTTKKIYHQAVKLNAEIYHFHDPELMPFAYWLKLKGKTVIYDSHEDLPRQLVSKPYINRFFSNFLSLVFEKVENFFSKRFSAIITATPHIKERFLKINPNTLDVNNYPILEEFHNTSDNTFKKNQACFVGGITEIRGIEPLVRACDKINGKLVLVGRFSDTSFKNKIKRLDGWKNVDYRGFLSRQEVKTILAESKVGIVTFLSAPNHINSQPNKMFEYMSASLPVLSSNFRLWKSIIETNKCGYCVNPQDSAGIAEKINLLFENDNLVEQLGNNGRSSVKNIFHWGIEEKKLLKLYKTYENSNNSRGKATVC